MSRAHLGPADILEKLCVIDSLVSDGRPVADALRIAGVVAPEYEKWRSEYAGLLRTLGPLALRSPEAGKKPRRSRRARPIKTG